jgi:ADP-ribosyl-[dinitrogen reductase] hydrolase
MRLAPVPMFYVDDLEQVAHRAGESSRTTHGAREAVDACRLFGVMIALALRGEPKERVLLDGYAAATRAAELAPSIAGIAAGQYRGKRENEVRGSGYVADSLEAALWCFWRTETYEEAVLRAVNLGDDADTTGAVCGQIAGAYYGVGCIPQDWLISLAMREYIEDVAIRLCHDCRQNQTESQERDER